MSVRPLDLDDLDRLHLLGQARISPDGRQVAYIDASYDLDADTTAWGIHVVPTDGGQPRRLTAGPKDSLPRWSPDARRVAFVRGDGLCTVDIDTGIVVRQAVLPAGVDDYTWSPEGDGFAVLAAPAAPDTAGIVHVTRLGQRAYTGWQGARSQVWWCPLGGEPRRLTDIAAGVTAPRFAPDGRITFGAATDDDYDLHPLQDLWAVSRTGDEPTRIGGPCNQLRGHQVLADGRVLHVGVPGTEWDYGVVTARLFVDGDDVTGILDRTVGRETEVVSHTLEYLSATVPPVIDDEGRVWFNVVDRGCAHVYRLDDDGKPVAVLTGPRLIGDFSVAGGLIAWIETSTERVQTLRVARDDGSDERVLVDPNPWLAERELGEMRPVPLTLADGTELDAWVVLPAGWDGTPLPAVVDIHPGPHSSFAWDFRLDQRLLAEAGFAVLSCNHPGSAGYGATFAKRLQGRWGDEDLPAYVALADEAVRLGYAAPGRIGVSGITTGSYAALWALSHTDRFRAAVVNRALSDMWSFYGASDIGHWYGPAVLGAEPWDDPDVYRRSSPVAHAHEVTAPVRFLCFAGNTRTLTEQSEAFFIRLRKRRVPTDIVVYPPGTATVFMPGTPSLRRHMTESTVEWFQRYL